MTPGDRGEQAQVPGEFDLIAWRVPEIAGDWRAHDWLDPDDERIAAIREEFRPVRSSSAETELQTILALKRWVRSRWDHGWSMSYRTADALILREAGRGEQFNWATTARVRRVRDRPAYPPAR